MKQGEGWGGSGGERRESEGGRSAREGEGGSGGQRGESEGGTSVSEGWGGWKQEEDH